MIPDRLYEKIRLLKPETVEVVELFVDALIEKEIR